MFFSVLALAVLMALPAWGILVDCQDYLSQAGVRLGSGQLDLAEGQMIEGTVALPMALARHGLNGVKKGDAVQVTFIRDRRFKLMHVPSGASVEITYRPKK
jgi:hypothetical protein